MNNQGYFYRLLLLNVSPLVQTVCSYIKFDFQVQIWVTAPTTSIIIMSTSDTTSPMITISLKAFDSQWNRNWGGGGAGSYYAQALELILRKL